MRVKLTVHGDASSLEAIPEAWTVRSVIDDQRSSVMAALTEPGEFDYAVFWPVTDDPASGVNISRTFRMIDAVKAVHASTAKYMPVGLYGRRWRDGALEAFPWRWAS